MAAGAQERNHPPPPPSLPSLSLSLLWTLPVLLWIPAAGKALNGSGDSAEPPPASAATATGTKPGDFAAKRSPQRKRSESDVFDAIFAGGVDEDETPVRCWVCGSVGCAGVWGVRKGGV